MLEKGSNIKFNGHHKRLNVFFVIYAVFESILKRVVTDTMVDNLDEFCTYKYREEHSACTYEYKVVCVDDRFRKPEPKKLR